jgi:hypothetical protein
LPERCPELVTFAQESRGEARGDAQEVRLGAICSLRSFHADHKSAIAT